MADEFEQQMVQWIRGLPVEGQIAVSNAAAAVVGMPAKNDVLVARAAVQDLMVAEAPVYVDVFGLSPVWGKLAYRENVLIKGPKGVGKSLSIVTFCKDTQTPLVVVEGSEDTKKSDLAGSFTMRNQETVFVLGAIPTAIDVANEVGRCVLVFEEINALTPQVQKMTNAILDFRKSISIPQIGRSYHLKPGAHLWVTATMNPSIYGGTYDLNEDLKSRVEEVEIGYPPFESEKKILKAACPGKVPDGLLDQILRFAGDTRQGATGYALSTRDLVRLVSTIEVLGLDAALQMLCCKFEGDDRATIIGRVSSHFVGTSSMRKHWGSST